jgi:dienelactone hydrolase
MGALLDGELLMIPPGFTEYQFKSHSIVHRVFRKGAGPAVLVMHELPGMVPEFIRLAEVIADNGFSVHLPLFFGEPGNYAPVRFAVGMCIRREIYLFAKNGGSPIVSWLRELCQKVWAEAGGPGVGVIGLCMTGNFAISLMADESVLAPVASEPALPVGTFTASRRAALAVTEVELAGAIRRCAAGQPIMALRFSGDTISPGDRLDALRTAFGRNLRAVEIDSSPGNCWGIRRKAHSVLTLDFSNETGHPTSKARDEVVEFLRQRLLGYH